MRADDFHRPALLIVTDVLVLTAFAADKDQQTLFVIAVTGFAPHLVGHLHRPSQRIAFGQNAAAVGKHFFNHFPVVVEIQVFAAA